jgi:hypothetical protein
MYPLGGRYRGRAKGGGPSHLDGGGVAGAEQLSGPRYWAPRAGIPHAGKKMKVCQGLIPGGSDKGPEAGGSPTPRMVSWGWV